MECGSGEMSSGLRECSPSVIVFNRSRRRSRRQQRIRRLPVRLSTGRRLGRLALNRLFNSIFSGVKVRWGTEVVMVVSRVVGSLSDILSSSSLRVWSVETAQRLQDDEMADGKWN